MPLNFAKHDILFVFEKNSADWDNFLKKFNTSASFQFVTTASDDFLETLKKSKSVKFEGIILAVNENRIAEFLPILKNFDEHLSITFLADKMKPQSFERFGDYDPSMLCRCLSTKTFLENPEIVLDRMVRQTFYHQRFAETQRNLQVLSRLQQAFQHGSFADDDLFSFLLIPIHEVGGDFVNVFYEKGEEFLVVVGDVSGHNLESAFISAYFQGFLRGSLQQGKNVVDILKTFNSIFVQEWKKTNEVLPLPQSISLCLVQGDLSKKELLFIACGFPQIFIVQQDGSINLIEHNGYPLGWFEDLPLSFSSIKIDNANFIYICTDGLLDYAKQQDINELAFIYILLQFKPELLVTRAFDDILAMQINLKPHTSIDSILVPIFERTYFGNSAHHIDQYQDQLAKNIKLIFPYIAEEKMNHILVCLREALLNALLHGCKNLVTEKCILRINYIKSKRKLLFTISDSGKGHDFKSQIAHGELFAQPQGNSFGLAIIHNLSQNVHFSEGGATISFEFFLSSDESKPSIEFSKVIKNEKTSD